MDDLVEWLRAQLDERARAARAACQGGEGRWHQPDPDREPGRIEDESGEVVTYDEGSPSGYQAAHIALNDPATVLREVEAFRLILDEHVHEHATGEPGFGCRTCAWQGSWEGVGADGWCRTVRLLALSLADCPGYRSEWAPSVSRVNPA